MPLHSDQEMLNRSVGENIRLAGELGMLTDANVIAATSVADLKSNIQTNALTKHADQQGYVFGLLRALDLGKDDGTLTDAAVQAATGVSNLASLTLSDPGKIGPLSA
jgi:hypothetical protein